MKLTKLSSLIKNLKEIEKKFGNLIVVYASDDEGNRFHKVYNDPIPVQIHSLDEEVEIVGFYSRDNISKKDVNAVCIN